MTIESEINEPLMRAVVDRIINDPDSFHMGSWGQKTLCGSTACVAGSALLECGGSFVFETNGHLAKALDPSGVQVRTFDFAREALGLNHEDADEIFMSMYWCEDQQTPSEYENSIPWYSSNCKCTSKHAYASARQTIENISKITGLEFKIPEDLP